MKDITTFETAVRLKEAGFPQPTPEAGQWWYNPDYGIFLTGKPSPYDGRERHIYYPDTGNVFFKNQGLFPDCVFAPTATDILRELGPLFDLSYDCAEFWCGDKKGWNPAEAAAEAWIKLNPKIKEDFIRQTEEE